MQIEKELFSSLSSAYSYGQLLLSDATKFNLLFQDSVKSKDLPESLESRFAWKAGKGQYKKIFQILKESDVEIRDLSVHHVLGEICQQKLKAGCFDQVVELIKSVPEYETREFLFESSYKDLLNADCFDGLIELHNTVRRWKDSLCDRQKLFEELTKAGQNAVALRLGKLISDEKGIDSLG